MTLQSNLNSSKNSILTDDQKNNDLFIIGCGLARTATSSMREALNKLGFKCYHMKQVFIEGKEHQLKWIKVGKQKLFLKKSANIQSYNEWSKIQVNYDWNEIFGSSATKDGKAYTATTDAPSVAFYQEIMKYYPNHRVILTVRDSPESWYNSAIQTIYYSSRYYAGSLYFYLFNKLFYRHNILATKCYWDLLFYDKYENKEYAMNKYDEWNKNAIDYVDKDKLLIFNAKHDSWDKLCKFLNIKEIPTEPFPHVNERKILKNSSITQRRKAVGFNIVFAIVIMTFIWYLYKWYKLKR